MSKLCRFSYGLWRIVNSSEARFISFWCAWLKLVINHDLEIPVSLHWFDHKWIMDDRIKHSCPPCSCLKAGEMNPSQVSKEIHAKDRCPVQRKLIQKLEEIHISFDFWGKSGSARLLNTLFLFSLNCMYHDSLQQFIHKDMLASSQHLLIWWSNELQNNLLPKEGWRISDLNAYSKLQ